MAIPTPNFYIEQSTSYAYGATPTPVFTHNFWKINNVYPEIKGTFNNGTYDSWAFTASGLASGIVNNYFYWKRNLQQYAGRNFDKWAFCIAGIGNGGFTQNPNSSGKWLMNHVADMTSGATFSGPTNLDFYVPWSVTGVHIYKAWGSGFWPELRKLFIASGIPFPDVFAITSEQNLPDLTWGWTPQTTLDSTGWIPRALRDPRATGILFDGVQTFQQYWNNTTGWYDGTPIPTGVIDTGFGGFRNAPENFKFKHKYVAAYVNGASYATLKGIIEPMYAMFSSGIPVAEYRLYSTSPTSPVKDYYPSDGEWLFRLSHTAQGPDFYRFPPMPFNAQEDGIPPYWPSVTGWIQTFPRPDGYIGYSAIDYASIEYGKQKIVNAARSNPNQPVFAWLSLEDNFSNTDIQVMIEVIKYALLNGVYNFYVFDGFVLTRPESLDAWETIVNTVNSWVYEQNSASGSMDSYDVSTVCKFGCGFLKF